MAVSGLIAAFVSPTLVRRLLPKRTVVAVPVSAAAGALLPVCECSSVPVARRLMERIALTGDYRRYVKPGMGVWLLVAGLAVTCLGLA